MGDKRPCREGLKGIRKEMKRREGDAPMCTPYATLFWLQIDCAGCGLQDHERIEGCDAAVAADISIRVPAAACCDPERDRGVRGGEGAVPFLSILDRAVKRAMAVKASVM